MAARIVVASQLFWHAHGHLSEGHRWLTEVLAHPAAISPATRAKALFVAGAFAWLSGDHSAALAPLEESLALFQQIIDRCIKC